MKANWSLSQRAGRHQEVSGELGQDPFLSKPLELVPFDTLLPLLAF